MNPIPSASLNMPWPSAALADAQAPTPPSLPTQGDDDKLREVFHQFVGETFYQQLLASMRKTVDKPAYLHGGRGEEAFQAQLDIVLADKMSQATEHSFSESMYQMFQLQRR